MALRRGRGSLAPWVLGAFLLHALVWSMWRERVIRTSTDVPAARAVPRISLVSLVARPPAPPRAEPAPASPPPPSIPKPPPPQPIAKRPPPPMLAPKPVPLEAAPIAPSAAVGDPAKAVVEAALPAVGAPNSSPPPEAVAPGVDESEVARYVALVRTRVDARKVYPAIARRRGLEGRVVARLRIDGSGRLLDLDTVDGSSAVLGRSARDAIEAAAPFPPPPDGEFELEIALQYSLDSR